MRVSAETVGRARRHALEIALVASAAVILGQLGVFAQETPIWLVPVTFLAGAALIVVVYTIFSTDADARGVHVRMLTQSGVLAAITYATGWGFALPLVHIFMIADNVKYAGSGTISSGLRVAAGWTFVAQLMLQAGLLPSVHEPLLDTWAIAALMLGAVLSVSLRIRQMTALREEAERSARGSEERFRALVEDANDVVLIVADGIITYQSPSAQNVLGYRTSETVGLTYLSFVHPDDAHETLLHVLELIKQPSSARLIECRVRHREGHWTPVETSVRNLTDNPSVGGFVLNMRDITERRGFEELLEHHAFHDPLTSLPNRALFLERVSHAVARAERAETRTALLYIDLDAFKVVNDTLGHGPGDDALVATAQRIQRVIRAGDTAARLGGDEFAVLLEDYEGDETPSRTAGRILAALAEPFASHGARIELAASVGIGVWRAGWSPDDLIRNADIAMYMAKSSGKGRYELFDSDMHATVVARLEMERDLHAALDAGQLRLDYQPIVSLKDRSIVGLEALLRWDHPVHGPIGPVDFIPVAEETGAILPIGRWVLQEAFRQTVLWQKRQPRGAPPLHISVNVSMKQLAQGDIVADVARALRLTGIHPTTVVLELTESALVDDTERAVSILNNLKTLGVRLAIDDFGTGYSSLSYLQRFPLDVLKIDRSFLDGMVRGTESPALVRAIIDMSRSLELQTVAEGIEQEDELQRVRAMQCDLGQGYLFARPMAAAAIDAILESSYGPRSIGTSAVTRIA